jgi:hypothetical protein
MNKQEKKYIQVDVLNHEFDSIGTVPVMEQSFNYMIGLINDYKLFFIANEEGNILTLHSKYYGDSGYQYDMIDQTID